MGGWPRLAVQPGDTGYSANANIELWTVSDAGYDGNNQFRNSSARYVLPSTDEWYKAAYYDPTNQVYYNYPTGSDTAPTDVKNGTNSGTAVYAQPYYQGPADIKDAGGLSPFGTMGQGGNVMEWQETERYSPNNAVDEERGARGGSWYNSTGSLRPSTPYYNGPTNQNFDYGFRVATAPEPGSAVLLATALTGWFLWRRRK